MRDSSYSIGGEVVVSRGRAWEAPRTRRTRIENRLILCAVALVVLLVTLPRLQRIAVRENEMDALRMLELLAPRVLAEETEPELRLGALLSRDGDLARRLADLEWLEGGRLVLRHGYLFELVELDGRVPALRAWPWRRGRTGLGAFVSVAGDGLLANRNDHPDESRRWSGPSRPPRVDAEALATWRRVQLPDTRTESY